jgi:hypothetical protein
MSMHPQGEEPSPAEHVVNCAHEPVAVLILQHANGRLLVMPIAGERETAIANLLGGAVDKVPGAGRVYGLCGVCFESFGTRVLSERDQAAGVTS